MQHDGELKYFKDMAGYVKKRIEDEEKGTSGWHVIVGKYSSIKGSPYHSTQMRGRHWRSVKNLLSVSFSCLKKC